MFAQEARPSDVYTSLITAPSLENHRQRYLVCVALQACHPSRLHAPARLHAPNVCHPSVALATGGSAFRRDSESAPYKITHTLTMSPAPPSRTTASPPSLVSPFSIVIPRARGAGDLLSLRRPRNHVPRIPLLRVHHGEQFAPPLHWCDQQHRPPSRAA